MTERTSSLRSTRLDDPWSMTSAGRCVVSTWAIGRKQTAMSRNVFVHLNEKNIKYFTVCTLQSFSTTDQSDQSVKIDLVPSKNGYMVVSWVIGVHPVIILILVGLSFTNHPASLGYPHDYGTPQKITISSASPVRIPKVFEGRGWDLIVDAAKNKTVNLPWMFIPASI